MDEGLWVMTANWGRLMSHLKHTGLRRSDDDNNDNDDDNGNKDTENCNFPTLLVVM